MKNVRIKKQRRVLVIIPTHRAVISDFGAVVPDPQGLERIRAGLKSAKGHVDKGQEVVIGICGGYCHRSREGLCVSLAEVYRKSIPDAAGASLVIYGDSDATVPDLIGLAKKLRFERFSQVVFCSQPVHFRSVAATLWLLFRCRILEEGTPGRLSRFYSFFRAYNWVDPLWILPLGLLLRSYTRRRGRAFGESITHQLRCLPE